jgi:hypothetical protein
MPEIIACPDCDKKLRVPDGLLGKKVRCPGCGGMFLATAGGVTGPVTDEPPSPQARRPARPSRSEAIEEKPRAPARRPSAPPRDDEDEDDRPRSRRREEEEEDEDHPRRREPYDEDEEDEDTPRPRSKREGWRKVRLGINLIIISIWVILGLVVVSMCGGVLIGVTGAASMSSARTSGQAVGDPSAAATGFGVIALMALVFVIGLASNVLRLAGHGFCMAVPPKRGSAIKGLAVATFALAVGQIVCSYLGNVVSWVSGAGFAGTGIRVNPALGLGGSGAAIGLALLGMAAGIASYIVFLFFLRSVAFAVRQPDLARTIRTFLIAVASALGATIVAYGLMIALVGAAVVSSFGGGGRAPNQAAAGALGGVMILFMVFGCVFVVAGLGLFVWYIVILHQVRGAIDRYLRRM